MTVPISGRTPVIHECLYCFKIFNRSDKLISHVATHSDARPFSCDMCPKSFKRQTTLHWHKKNHVDPRRYKCGECGVRYATKQTRDWHHEMKHLKLFKVMCKICNAGFPSESRLRAHNNARHSDNLAVCPICSRILCNKQSLKQHIMRHEDGYGESYDHQCPACNKMFLQELHVKKHYHRMHVQNGNPFICEVCGKNITTKAGLNKHLQLHEGTKSFMCQECGKCFADAAGLTVHLRTHTGAKPYKCNVCDKCFTQKSTLTVHMRYHTGEKPYSCDMCRKSFVTRTILNMHKRSKHQLPE